MRSFVRRTALVAAALALLALLAQPAAATNYVTQFVYDELGRMKTSRTYDTDSDPGNCGSLGHICSGTATTAGACNQGRCGVWAGGSFIDPTTDPANCQDVGHGCPAPENGYPTCKDGTCGFECAASYTPANARCVDLLSDPFNCGSAGNVCEGADLCNGGTCGPADVVPSVTDVLGVAPGGVAFRSPVWRGLEVHGAGLDQVTSVVLEDWGRDAASDSAQDPSMPADAGLSVPMRGRPIPFAGTPGTLTISASTLRALDWPFTLHEWYKLRLHYRDGNGLDQSLLVDVPFSFEQALVDLPPPEITSVSVWAYRDTDGYEPSTGFVRTLQDLTGLRPRPSAVLGANGVEYPILAITPQGIQLQAGLHPGVVLSGPSSEPLWIALVAPYTNAPEDVISLGWPPGGAILRGANLVCDDASLFLSDALGNQANGTVQADCAPDRVLVAVDLEDQDATEEWASVTFASARGTVVTPWLLRWRGVPVIYGASADHVLYGQEMILTGLWFEDLTSVVLQYSDAAGVVSESLAPSASQSGPLGPDEYRIIDDKHLAVMLATNGPVPRTLRLVCGVCGTVVAEPFPGMRYFSVANPERARWSWDPPFSMPAVDPSGPGAAGSCPPPSRVCSHLPTTMSGQSSSSAPTRASPDSGPSSPINRGGSSSSGGPCDASNRVCMP